MTTWPDLDALTAADLDHLLPVFAALAETCTERGHARMAQAAYAVATERYRRDNPELAALPLPPLDELPTTTLAALVSALDRPGGSPGLAAWREDTQRAAFAAVSRRVTARRQRAERRGRW
ncbi:hypothetical protein ACN27E_13735 [Mycobacterium sp. WMMD1722]|uniref:hypothetical protein n=1 Tax=Mycobacterium sp. WMMD1722 TaxID=3404117 RepID=UPI003BF4B8B9